MKLESTGSISLVLCIFSHETNFKHARKWAVLFLYKLSENGLFSQISTGLIFLVSNPPSLRLYHQNASKVRCFGTWIVSFGYAQQGLLCWVH